MVNRIKYTRKTIEGLDSPITHRTRKQQKYRNYLAKELRESRKMGDAGRILAEKTLNKSKNDFEYWMAKYGTDKQGSLHIIKHLGRREYDDFFENIDKFYGLDKEVAIALINHFNVNELQYDFFDNIDKFSGLDEEVAIEFFEKIMTRYQLDPNSYFGHFWKNLDRFSVGNKFIINFFNKYKGGWGKTSALRALLKLGYYKNINYDEEFIKYLLENNIGDIETIWGLKKPLLDKKRTFDKSDANYINKLANSGLGEKIKDRLKDNIMKFPDKSLNISVFDLCYKAVYLDCYVHERRFRSRLDENSFKKFKKYSEKEMEQRRKNTSYYVYYRRRYYSVYEVPEMEKKKKTQRDNNLKKMENMSFGDILSLYLSSDDTGKEEIKGQEILEILLSKNVESGEVTKEQVNELFTKIDSQTQKRFAKKLKKVDLK